MTTLAAPMKVFNPATSEWVILLPQTIVSQVDGLQTVLDEIDAVAKGASRAMVFDTVAALDAWLAVAANKSALRVGDNFYIKELEVPDYWWDGEQKQQLETEKVDLSNATPLADGLMSSSDKSKLDGIAVGATRVTTPSDINAVPTERKINNKTLTGDINLTAGDVGAATAEQGAKADTALQSVPVVTSEIDGLMSKDDKTKLDTMPSITVGSTAPTNPQPGHIWVDTSN